MLSEYVTKETFLDSFESVVQFYLTLSSEISTTIWSALLLSNVHCIPTLHWAASTLFLSANGTAYDIYLFIQETFHLILNQAYKVSIDI